MKAGALSSACQRRDGPSLITLAARDATWRWDVLAPEVWRLQAQRHHAPRPFPTGAVVARDWPAMPAPLVTSNRGAVRFHTTSGTCCLRRASGAWEIRDPSGLPVFEAPPGWITWSDGRPRLELGLAERDRLLGLGEATGPFDRRGLTRELWNIDVLGHAPMIHPSLRSLYVSIPFLLLLRDGRAAGLFWDNPARQVWDLGETRADRLVVTADSGPLDLYLFLGPTPADVVRRFTELTGRMPLPPRWALGYHQCRYSYRSRARLEAVAREFRRRQIPCDALYLDIDHLDGYRVFTFGRAFPRPAEMIRRLRRRGFRVVVIVDPGVKDDPRFGVWRRGRALEAFIQRPDGRRDQVDRVWPGRSRWPDFLNAQVRQWWGREQARVQRLGVAGFWNDMNEPATFTQPTKTLPPGCVHRTDTGPVRHRRVHNLYGSAMAQASREGALAQDPDARPFIITRAAYAGIQRHALVWTGDNSSCWEHLADSIPLLLNLGLSGVPFCGSDVGGFLGNPTGELLARWTQLAALTPFFRNHTFTGTRDQEPWVFGPRIEAICRRAIETRYQLLPYLYGLFVEAHRHGTPIMRPLAWHFANDPVAVACSDQFLLGDSLLVAPVVRPGAESRSVYLPAGSWWDANTGTRYFGRNHVLARADLETLPLYVRAGALVPMIEVRPHLSGKRPDVINLHVWPGAPGELNWVEDDGASLGYERGEWLERRIRFTPHPRGGELTFGPAQGRYASDVKTWRIIVRAAQRAFRVGGDASIRRSGLIPEAGVFAIESRNRAGALRIRWR